MAVGKWDVEDEEELAAAEQQRAEKLAKKQAMRQEKKRKLNSTVAQEADRSDEAEDENNTNRKRQGAVNLTTVRRLRFQMPEIQSCRHIERYEKLNHIEEGSYGVVFRARESGTGDIVAVKRLKMDKERDGFPITSLREITTLMAARHPHVVNIREVVMGDALTDVYIVMDFVEHDLKSLLEDMREPFLQSEVKTLMLQLCSAVAHMHLNWIVHRDLKTSNLLMTNRGEMKIADFGLARYYSKPVENMTELVVTLWYRAPELLFGTKTYSTEIDLWSIGCIMAELLLKEPLFQGKSEIDQLIKIIGLTGVPSEANWPGFSRLPNASKLKFPPNKQAEGSVLRSKFPLLTSTGVNLLSKLLTLDPAQRITAEQALQHPWFAEDPRPKPTEFMPTYPSKAGGERRRRHDSPQAPSRGAAPELPNEGLLFGEDEAKGAGFRLRF